MKNWKCGMTGDNVDDLGGMLQLIVYSFGNMLILEEHMETFPVFQVISLDVADEAC